MKVNVLGVHLYVSVKKPADVFSGFASRSLFYKILQKASPEDFRRIHVEGKPTPYYLTPFVDIKGKFIFKIREDGEYFIGVYSIARDLSKITWSLIEHETIETKNYLFEILGVAASSVDVKPLEVDLGDVIIMKFLTPTSFRVTPYSKIKSYGTYFPFPRPDLLLRSLVRTVGMSSNNGTPDYESIDLNALRLISFRDSSTMLIRDFMGRPYVGFTGTFYFEVKSASPILRLLSLAEYVGLGGWRTAGFGRVILDVARKGGVRNKTKYQSDKVNISI